MVEYFALINLLAVFRQLSALVSSFFFFLLPLVRGESVCVSRSWWRRTSEGRREGGREQQGELDRPRQQNNENMKSRTNSTVKTTRIQSQPKATPEAKRKRQATKLQAEIRGGEAPTPTDRLGNRNDDPTLPREPTRDERSNGCAAGGGAQQRHLLVPKRSTETMWDRVAWPQGCRRHVTIQWKIRGIKFCFFF